jgi:hypothetical protein
MHRSRAVCTLHGEPGNSATISRSSRSRRCTSASTAPRASKSVARAAGWESVIVLNHCWWRMVHPPPVLEPDPAPQQQLAQPVPATHQIHPDRLPGTNQVPQRLLLTARHTNRM